ncbi:hypothetical protein T552_02584 [Pneumocystis carinii B80]|uniref:Uncharacterized protein n=1 Tax=Pneumocystis carinii (strain B80) TaxID=1408658 RepID=A0A0W4ZFB3_PNEC8|nr:hypothetical protein T552_02584 [Pneumocystis carinii B80]KTW27092.1 hypothetical protein T552_02584 [Pneumocystis carinii B80]
MLIHVQTQIESYLVVIFTLSILCIFYPDKVLKQGIIYVLGDAMNLARPSRDPSGIVIVGMLLFQLSWIYLFALLKMNLTFFKDLAPLRTIQAFALILWIYFSNNPAISNGLTFTYAFFDLIWQFWMFVSFRSYQIPTT